jgi:tetratricopeptide (TPR) repeat protein
MAMKYVNFIAALLLVSGLIGVAGCATTSERSKANVSAGKAVEITLSSTLEFLPVVKVDNTGAALPYVPTENPYLLQKSKIKKESIAKYIEAARASKHKKYEQAELSLQELIAEDKVLSGPWVLLGDIAAEQNNDEKAIVNYLKAIELNDKNINAYLRLAKAQRTKGEFLKAQNTYAKLLGLWRDCPEAHLNLAVLYDVFLNHPLRAQKHMEAYQYLTGGEDANVAKWLTEIQQRTGVAAGLVIEKKKAESKPLS